MKIDGFETTHLETRGPRLWCAPCQMFGLPMQVVCDRCARPLVEKPVEKSTRPDMKPEQV